MGGRGSGLVALVALVALAVLVMGKERWSDGERGEEGIGWETTIGTVHWGGGTGGSTVVPRLIGG